ncbi:PE family protein [Mycobacterium malmoense]|uniref:PE domain-containing protein n=1 Tax=Mycobacterium malmoense TaxID=1780 RepID=A0ABX3SR12_MYCMA|nr:PE family protein [Mycobacterium malmoense]OIN81956.1 hypothetical protein BMG05_04455 [Mycobacterium malmoense]ORA80401.1 hypothetical protein BST29_16365 [Mycobacterium malmoense]QZA19636.1 PE family protein [Mycobacterium malmoense]UNB96388.1 PE family protein [Mycobacterium malmoense]
MSFVIAMPDLVEGAAQNLAGIHSSLAEAAATAAGPTTGIATAAQDEVSIAIASLFGNMGQEFQALSAQAQTFHQQFVSLMNAGAGAYASAEAANAGQAVLGGVDAPAQSLLGGALGNIGQNLGGAIAGGEATVGQLAGQVGQSFGALTGAAAGAPAAAPTLIQGINEFWTGVSAPYQALVANTGTNLQAIGTTFTADPFPFVQQIITNQQGFAQTFLNGVAVDLQGFPANVPANIQLAIQGASTFNPGALAQQFVNGQISTAQTVVTSLHNAAVDTITGVQTLPAGFQAAFQDLLVGNNIGAYGQIQQTLQNAFLPGFQPITVELAGTTPVPVVPLGPLGDLAPIFALPGQMAQSLTNLLPPGSIPAQIAQNFTNVFSALTNFGTTATGSLVTTFGLPLALVFDAIGAPAQALSALNSSAVAFVTAAQAGNASAAATALLDAPAYVANGFLNGQAVPIGNGLDINALIVLPPVIANVAGLGFSLSLATELPVGGLLTPLSTPFVVGGGPFAAGSTQIGGLIPGLLSIGPELAADITPIG